MNKTSKIKHEFLIEAEQQIDKVRKSEIEKEAMAYNVKQGPLQHSESSIRWMNQAEYNQQREQSTGIVSQGEQWEKAREQQIQNELRDKVAKYIAKAVTNPFLAKIELSTERQSVNKIQKQKDIPDSIKLRKEDLKEKEQDSKPDATISFTYRYRRQIIPISNTESADKANKSLDVLDSILNIGGKNLHDFISALDGLNIPLMPYYNATDFSSDAEGRVNRSLQDLIEFETSDNFKQLMKIPGDTPEESKNLINPDFFYTMHLKSRESSMQSGYNKKVISVVETSRKTRRYHFDELRNMRQGHSVLLKAIAMRRRLGYDLNTDSLKKNLDKHITYLTQIRGYDIEDALKKADKLKNIIIKAYNQAIQPIDPKEQNTQSKVYRWNNGEKGLDITGSRENAKSPILTSDDALYLFLESMRKDNDKSEHKDYFTVYLQTMRHHPNGFDSHFNDKYRELKEDKDAVTLVVPPVRQLPDKKNIDPNTGEEKSIKGQIVLDRDNHNMGNKHLRKSGKAIAHLIQMGWGKWCNVALQVLRSSMADILFQIDDSGTKFTDERGILEAREAWRVVIGGNDEYFPQNRTGAENFLAAVNDPNNQGWEQFNEKYVKRSLLDELHLFNKERKKHNPLIDKYNSGEISWDQLMDSFIPEFEKRNQRTELKTRIDESDYYDSILPYGYQVAKMMDFVSALMVRCDEIIYDNRSNKPFLKDKFYGKNYSTSSGTSGDGRITLSVKYFFDAMPYDATNNIEIGKGESVTSIARKFIIQEYTQYALGGSGIEGKLNEVKDWQSGETEQILHRFESLYPQIKDVLPRIHEPLKTMHQAFKQAIEQARLKIEQFMQIPLSVDFISSDKENVSIPTEQPQSRPQPRPQPQQAQPVSTQTDLVPEQVSTPVEPEVDTLSGDNWVDPNVDKSKVDKSMPMSPRQDRIRRRNNSKLSIAPEGYINKASVIDKLTQIADKLDSHRHSRTADKLDKLIKLINKEK